MRPGIGAAAIVTIVTILAICSSSVAQTRPAEPDPIENRFIRSTAVSATTRASTGANVLTKAPGTNFVDFRRLLLSLGAVLAIIFVMRWAGKWFFPSLAGARSTSAVRVLARTPVAHKQQVLLVQVGRRVLVVADNGTQMNRLAEITDADEVASLIGQIAAPHSEAATDAMQANGGFASEFGKARDTFDDPARLPPVEDSDSIDAGHTIAAEEDSAADSSILSASGEISGLMEKVRILARQLGR